jgi:hypothetical protein
VTRRRDHLPGLDVEVREPAHRPSTVPETWPGKHAPASTLVKSARSAPVIAAPARPTPVADEAIDALDLHVQRLQRDPPAIDEHHVWAAQQDRGARWQQLLRWADQHRARR